MNVYGGFHVDFGRHHRTSDIRCSKLCTFF